MIAVNKVQAVIGAVLGIAGRPMRRTKLVKLIYLADNRFYELNGRTLTGLSYVWDNYGPNAISNALVKEASSLVSSGKASMVAKPSIYGTDEYVYWIAQTTEQEYMEQLGPGERQILRDILEDFGRMSVRNIVAASKRTAPFKNARQYDILKLETNPGAAAMQHRILSDSKFMAEARRGLDDLKNGRLTSQEELDKLYQGKS